METTSETSYRDDMDLTEEQADRFDTFAATLGFGPKSKPKPTKKHPCPACGMTNAYHKEIHPDTDMNEIVLYCPDCKAETEI